MGGLENQEAAGGYEGTPRKGLTWRHCQIESYGLRDRVAGSVVNSTPIVSRVFLLQTSHGDSEEASARVVPD